MAAAEWMADPDGDPSTADFPTVVNASWGAPSGAGEALRPIIARWRELGIVPVFAAGNTGRSVAAPAIYPRASRWGPWAPAGGSPASRAASRPSPVRRGR